MDIILYDYFNLDKGTNISFYWYEKNRTFNLLQKDYIKEGNNAVHNLKSILDGSYRLSLGTIKEIKFGIRVNDKIEYSEKAFKIYFKIETKPEIKISKLNKQIFIKNEYALKKGVANSAKKFWNLYWNNLHLLSFNYPESPKEEDKNEVIKLTKVMIKNGITCSKCRKHFTEWNKKNPIESSIGNRDYLVKWYIDLHNNVNTTNKKKVLTIEQVKELYKNFKYDTFVEKYKIDVIKLFNDRKLDTLPNTINSITRKILWKEFNVFQDQ